MSDDSAIAWNIPIWFVRLAAGVLTLAVPWAGWVTIQLTAINVRLEATAEMRRDVDTLASQIASHVTDVDVHLAGLGDVLRRVDRIEARVERLEGK
jgi:hypothetical protein